MSASWMGTFKGDNGGAENTGASTFSYGNMDEWMRWDSRAEGDRERATKRNSPIYVSSGEPSPIVDGHPRSSTQSSSVGPDLSGQATTSVDPASLSARVHVPFTFGSDTSRSMSFEFNQALMSQSAGEAQHQNAFYHDQLSWSQAGDLHVEPGIDLVPLSLEQQQHLRNIAFSRRTLDNLQQSPVSVTQSQQSESQSPELSHKFDSKKRKSFSEQDKGEVDPASKLVKQPPVKKTAHNMIEKRYRTNLNDKIATLRDCVPTLRNISGGPRGSGAGNDPDELEGLSPAHKLNKATVLSKATEYIHYLEKDNRKYKKLNEELQTRLHAFERLAMSGSLEFAKELNDASSATPYLQAPFENALPDSSVASPQGLSHGMICVPENPRRLHTGQHQQHYVIPQQAYHRFQAPPVRPPGQGNLNRSEGSGRGGGGLVSKLMMGSLAGLMVMEGFNEKEQGNETPAGRGLFSFPVELLRKFADHSGLHQRLGFDTLPGSSPLHGLILLLKISLVLGAVIYVLSPSFFDSKAKHSQKLKDTTQLSAAPSLASPIEVRRRAWLTAIQTVWVPRHNLLLELAALILKMFKLSLRNIVGWQGYSTLTGTTQDHEIARVKAWGIALDAQLAGGDAEINKSRLTLTLMASGTLPATPSRLMLKALHIRVLLWEVANAGYGGWFLLEETAAKLAKIQWNEARRLQKITASATTKEVEDSDTLPDHLIALLELDCDEVLTDGVIQRAYNLAWNRSTAYDTAEAQNGMDNVVEDLAIRSPLDAVSAWWSTGLLQKVLVAHVAQPEDKRSELEKDLDLAFKTAPPASGAQARALLAKSLLIAGGRHDSLTAALDLLPVRTSRPSTPTGLSASDIIFYNSHNPNLFTDDLRIAFECATLLALPSQAPSTAASAAQITAVLHDLTIHSPAIGILGFMGAFKLQELLSKGDGLSADTEEGLEQLAGFLRIWIGGECGRLSGLSKATRGKLVEKCLSVSRNIVGMKEASEVEDAGYGSLSDAESPKGEP